MIIFVRVRRPWVSRQAGRWCLAAVALSSLVAESVGLVAARSQDSQNAAGEDRRPLAAMSFGFKAGLSFGQHYGTEERHAEYDVTSDWRESFAAGAFLTFPITGRFGLQQELIYVRKGSRQRIGVEILDIPTVLDVTYDTDYIEIPVLTKFVWLRSEELEWTSTAGFALGLKVHDRYKLAGEVDDGTQIVPLRADADMSEVDMFDYAFVYGLGLEFPVFGHRFLVEHRFTIGWNVLLMPTYAYVPFEDEEILVDNEPVPLRNQNHLLLLGIRF